MFRLIKVLVVLALLGFGALVGFAYLGDLDPQSREMRVPVTLNAR